MNMHRPKPVILAIVSGFGIGPNMDRNAVRQANLPVFRELTETYPAMTLNASGSFVGRDQGACGTAEAGHRTIGAGRALYDPISRVSADVADGTFFKHPTLRKAFKRARTHEGAVHLIGLVSEANLQSKREHLEALLAYAKREQVRRVYVHAVLDGVDAMPESGRDTIRSFERTLGTLGIGSIASISGRSWAMDGDGRWDRIKRAYDAMALGRSMETFPSADAAIESSYANGVHDEAFAPCVIVQEGGIAATLSAGDACIFFNLRPAPERELVKAFTLPSFEPFNRPNPNGVHFVTLTEYDKDLPVDVAYPFQEYEGCLGQAISEAGMKQLRIAETERYAHVTNVFNGLRDNAFPGEDRVIVPSPNVSKYEQVPEMSTAEIANRTIKEIALGAYDVIIMNIAAPDLVAQTGNEAAAIKACEAADKGLGKVIDAALAVNGVLLLVSDHGHAEVVRDPATDEIVRTGTKNPVPFLTIGKMFEGIKAPTGDVVGGDLALTAPAGTLSDVAPTMLKILGLPAPKEMTGRPLV